MNKIKKTIDKLNTATTSVVEKTKTEKLDSLRRSVDKENLKVITSTRSKLLKATSMSIVVLSILASLAFSGPAEITAKQVDTQINQPPVVMDIGDYANTTSEDDDDDAAVSEKKGFAAFVYRIKQAVLSLPRAVRVGILLPLWFIGTGITTVFAAFWRVLFSSPIGAFITSTLLGYAVLIGLFALTAKLLFPELPLKQILNKKNLSILAVISIALAAADAVLPFFWHRYPLAAGAFKLCTGALVISILTARTKAIFDRTKYVLSMN